MKKSFLSNSLKQLEVINDGQYKLKFRKAPKNLASLTNHIRSSFGFASGEYQLQHINSDSQKNIITNEKSYSQILGSRTPKSCLTIERHAPPKQVQLGWGRIPLFAGQKDMKAMNRSLTIPIKRVNSEDAFLNGETAQHKRSESTDVFLIGQKAQHACEITKLVKHQAQDSEIKAMEIAQEAKAVAKKSLKIVKDRIGISRLKQQDGKYEGQVLNGMPAGYGVSKLDDGTIVRAEWKEGVAVIGSCVFENGDTYSGQFQNDGLNGLGVYTWVGGQIYAGEFLSSQKSGHGVFHWKNKDRYEGQWKDDNRTGYGIAVYAAGDLFEGQWLDGMKHGVGRYTYKDGRIYDGPYKFHKRHGEGIYVVQKLGKKY